jgi:hypothetical protein
MSRVRCRSDRESNVISGFGLFGATMKWSRSSGGLEPLKRWCRAPIRGFASWTASVDTGVALDATWARDIIKGGEALELPTMKLVEATADITRDSDADGVIDNEREELVLTSAYHAGCALERCCGGQSR